MLVAIDAIGIRGQGAASILCELLAWMPRVRPKWSWHVFLFDRHLRHFDIPPVPPQVTLEPLSLGNSGLQRMRWLGKHLPNRLAAIGPDVLFSMANIAPRTATVPQVVMVHQMAAFVHPPVFSLTRNIRLLLLRRALLAGARASRAVVVQTELMRATMSQFADSLRDQIHVIPSGWRQTSAEPQLRASIVSAMSIPSRPRLIYVSHPAKYKNHSNLLRAIPLIREAFPDVRLFLTLERSGGPDRLYRTIVREIESTVERCGVAGQVVWLGTLGADEVDYALRQCDLLAFPSLCESFGLPLVEAMAAGCPIAAADLPYAHDVAGDAASYFDPHDPQAIARSIVSVLSQPRLLAQLRAAGQRRKGSYAYRTIANSIAELLEQSCGQPKRRSAEQPALAVAKH